MNRKYFLFSHVYRFGWDTMARNFWFFVGIGLIWFVIKYLPTFIIIALNYASLPPMLFIIWRILYYLFNYTFVVILAVGMIKIALSFCNERKPSVGTLFDFVGCFWRYVGTAILYTLIVLGGLLLFIIPGIIWGIQFGLCFYFVVDKGLNPIRALKASSRTTKGVKWDLFAFHLINMGIVYLGLLCCFIGVFAAYPIVLVAQTLVYRQLAAQTPQLAEFEKPAQSLTPNPNWPKSQY